MTTELFPGVQLSSVPSTTITASAVNGQALGTGAARTLVTGSLLAVPNGGLSVGSKIKYRAVLTKTAAGVASATIDVGIGATGTTADAATVSFTTGTQTAAIDTAVVDIEALVTEISATAGGITGTMVLSHNLQATGFGPTSPIVETSTITNGDTSLADALYIGLYVTEGAANVVTVVSVEASLSGVTTGNPA